MAALISDAGIVWRPPKIGIAVPGGKAGDNLGSATIQRGDHQFDLPVFKAEEGQTLAIVTQICRAEAVRDGTRCAAERRHLPYRSVGFRDWGRIIN